MEVMEIVQSTQGIWWALPGSQPYAQLGRSKSVKEETQAASEKSLELLKSDVFEVTQS